MEYDCWEEEWLFPLVVVSSFQAEMMILILNFIHHDFYIMGLVDEINQANRYILLFDIV